MAAKKTKTTSVRKTRAKSKATAARTRTRTKPPELAAVLATLKVEEAVRRDLAKIGVRDPELAVGALAANALQLAREMDSDSSATSKSMCARALNETMEKIHALATPEEKGDMLDDLEKRRRARRAKAAAAL